MIHICVEGLDGTGKSTLVSALFKQISEASAAWVYQTKEPGAEMVVKPGFKIKRPGVDMRDIVLQDGSLTAFERELLFYVDASQHRRFIEAQGNAFVISDRGIWSHIAYARATMKTQQMTYDFYSLCRQLITAACAQPDVIVYLKGDLDLMKERLSGKTKDVIEKNGDAFFASVKETYDELCLEPKWAKSLLVLNARDSIDSNVEAVISFLKERYSNEELQSGNPTLSGR